MAKQAAAVPPSVDERNDSQMRYIDPLKTERDLSQPRRPRAVIEHTPGLFNLLDATPTPKSHYHRAKDTHPKYFHLKAV